MKGLASYMNIRKTLIPGNYTNSLSVAHQSRTWVLKYKHLIEYVILDISTQLKEFTASTLSSDNVLKDRCVFMCQGTQISNENILGGHLSN